jgi:hypothetical protein
MVAPALKKALFVTSTRIALMGLMRSIVIMPVSYMSSAVVMEHVSEENLCVMVMRIV